MYLAPIELSYEAVLTAYSSPQAEVYLDGCVSKCSCVEDIKETYMVQIWPWITEPEEVVLVRRYVPNAAQRGTYPEDGG